MHRIASRWAVVFAAAGLLAASSTGCAGGQVEKPELEEPARVERLRLKITKVRNAIEETRQTIARSQGAPYLPELYLRLAELLSEEARYHYQLAAERQQSTGGVSNVPQVRLLKNQAIDIYEMMVDRFEDSDLVPRALFNLGHEQRELGNFAKMRGAFQELIQNHRGSSLRNDALLVMGDYYFDRSKLDRAGRYYRLITRASLNKVSGLGHYKLAWVQINRGKCGSAIENFEDAIEDSRAWAERQKEAEVENRSEREGSISSRKDINVRREALVDLTYCYSREREVAGALDYLRGLADERDAYVAAVAELAHRYRLAENNRGAILASREVLKLGSANRDRLQDARTFYTALKNREDYRAIGDDAELIANVYRRFYSQAPVREQERERLREEFENYLRDLSTRAQTQLKRVRGEIGPGEGATDTGRPPGRVDADDLARQVADSYRVYLSTFPRAANRPAMTLNLSEVLGGMGESLRAGKRALEAAGMHEEGEQQRNALYDAVVFFQETLEERTEHREYKRVAARASLRRAAQKLLGYSLEDDKERRVKFAVAKSFFGEGRYLQAVDQLSAVAYEFPESDEADAAIRLVLDAYDTLNDYDGLRFTSRRFLQDASPASRGLRADIRKILEDAQQRKLDQLSLKAAGDEGGDLSPLLKFAEQHQGEELGERSLINAFVAARAMGNTTKMYKLADKVASQYPDSDQLPGIYTTVAKVARARFEFEKAIRFMRRAAGVNPDKEVELLTAAGEIYEQMGLAAKAEEHYRKAIEAASGAQIGDPAGKLAALLERHKSGRELVQKLEPYADSGSPEVLARLGLAYVSVGDTDQAEKMFERVLQGGTQASVGATARAQYGVAETLLATIEEFPPPDNIERVRKFISLVEVAQQKYINAARQGNSTYTAASLSRLSRMLEVAEKRLREMKLPSGLTSAQRAKVKQALNARRKATKKGAEEALTSCKNQLWSNRNFTPVVRKCLKGETLDRTLAPFDTVDKGSVSGGASNVAKLREKVSKNPKDIESLRELGNEFLSASAPHAARIVFAQAVQHGGGPRERNLLGIARHRVGNLTGAFDAFVQAAKGGLEAGRQNLATLAERAGFPEVKKKALERFPKGESGGRTLAVVGSEVPPAEGMRAAVESGEDCRDRNARRTGEESACVR